MGKKIFLMPVLLFWVTSLFAQGISRKQADEIIINYVNSEVQRPDLCFLYFNNNTPSKSGITITTSNDETFRAKYACWTYCLNESEPARRRYLFVQEEGGNLLEVIANNDISELGASWAAMSLTGLIYPDKNVKLLYPNPVDDWLTVPCDRDNTRIEIYDLDGMRIFYELFSGKGAQRLNVSFLSAGAYLVNISGKTYKIIKK